MRLSVSLALCFPFSSHAQDSCGLLAEVLRGRFVAASGSSVEKNSGSPPFTAHPTPPHTPAPSVCTGDGWAEITGGEGGLKRVKRRWNAGREHNLIWHSELHYGWLTHAQPATRNRKHKPPGLPAWLSPSTAPLISWGFPLFFFFLSLSLSLLLCPNFSTISADESECEGRALTGVVLVDYLFSFFFPWFCPSWDTVRRHFSTWFAEDWFWLTASYLHKKGVHGIQAASLEF